MTQDRDVSGLKVHRPQCAPQPQVERLYSHTHHQQRTRPFLLACSPGLHQVAVVVRSRLPQANDARRYVQSSSTKRLRTTRTWAPEATTDRSLSLPGFPLPELARNVAQRRHHGGDGSVHGRRRGGGGARPAGRLVHPVAVRAEAGAAVCISGLAPEAGGLRRLAGVAAGREHEACGWCCCRCSGGSGRPGTRRVCGGLVLR